MSTDTRHPQYDDATLLAAIEAALQEMRQAYATTIGSTLLCHPLGRPRLCWPAEAPARLALARGLLARLPETPPPVVDGKTPGQVAFDAFINGSDSWEAAAQAVITAFGQIQDADELEQRTIEQAAKIRELFDRAEKAEARPCQPGRAGLGLGPDIRYPMTRLRPPPRRSHSPACPPTASHATPPARRVWVPGREKGQLAIKMPHSSFFCGFPAHYDVREWNERAPEELRLRANERGLLCTDRGPYEFGPSLVESFRKLSYTASYGFALDGNFKKVFTVFLNLPAVPGHWQVRPIGAKNRAALGWPSLDKPAGLA